jgi:hypothetical protein
MAWARDRLTPLLGKPEATGRCNVYNIGDYHDPFVTRL